MTLQANLKLPMLFPSQAFHYIKRGWLAVMSHHPHQSSLCARIPQQNLLHCLHMPRYIGSLFCGLFLLLDFFPSYLWEWNCYTSRQICSKMLKEYQFSRKVYFFSSSKHRIKWELKQTNTFNLLTKSRLIVAFKPLPGNFPVRMVGRLGLLHSHQQQPASGLLPMWRPCNHHIKSPWLFLDTHGLMGHAISSCATFKYNTDWFARALTKFRVLLWKMAFKSWTFTLLIQHLPNILRSS